MNTPITVSFGDVKPGDKVYNPHQFYDPWERVTEIEVGERYVTLKVGLTYHPKIDTRSCFVGLKREAISIIPSPLG